MSAAIRDEIRHEIAYTIIPFVIKTLTVSQDFANKSKLICSHKVGVRIFRLQFIKQ